MILKLYWVLVAWLLCCSYSYSETISEQTKNTVSPGLTWTMTNVLPQYTGLTVNAVNYKYTAVKIPQDPFVVTVANANTNNTGYIFRSQDNWTGLPGNTLTKTVMVNNIPGVLWGFGSITTTGTGSIQDAEVKYSYRYDSCFNTATIDPSCPNYKLKLPSLNWNNESPASELQQFQESSEDLVLVKQLLELEQTKKPQVLKKAATNTLANTTVSQALEDANAIPSIYKLSLFGGAYSDSVKLVDSRLPDSRNGQRLSSSQEILHNRMVDQQYNQGIRK